MKQKSRRAKGKKLQRILREKLLTAFPHLRQSDIRIAKTGEVGEDLKISRIVFNNKLICPVPTKISHVHRIN